MFHVEQPKRNHPLALPPGYDPSVEDSVVQPPDASDRRPMFAGILALCMAIGGFRFTHGVRLLFDQNTQHYISKTGEVTYGPRPWPEPWLLVYFIAASSLMMAGGLGLLRRRRWGLTLTAFAGMAWTITSMGFSASHYSFMVRVRSLVPGPSLWTSPGWLVEIASAVLATVVGVGFLTLYLRPQWINLDSVSTPTAKRLTTIFALLGWGLVSIAMSMVFARWLLERTP